MGIRAASDRVVMRIKGVNIYQAVPDVVEYFLVSRVSDPEPAVKQSDPRTLVLGGPQRLSCLVSANVRMILREVNGTFAIPTPHP